MAGISKEQLFDSVEKVKKYIDDKDEPIIKKLEPIVKYHKYVNTELDYFYARCAMSGLSITTSTTLPYILTFDSRMLSKNITIGDDGVIKLNANKTYKISLTTRVGSSNGSNLLDIWIYNKTANEFIGFASPVTTGYGAYWSDKDSEVIIETTEDTEIYVRINSIYGTGTITTVQGDISIQEIGREITIDPVEYVNTESGIEDSPVGTIIDFTSLTAPKHYLICDGTEHDISDYPQLAEYFESAYNAINYFGGDGETTFATPKLCEVKNIISWNGALIDQKYINETTNTFAILGGRSYCKVNESPAIAVIAISGSSVFTILISDNEEAVQGYCSYNTSDISSTHATFTYNDMTWYASIIPYYWTNTTTYSGAECITLETNYTSPSLETNAESIAIDILTIIEVYSLESQKYIKYEPTYFMKNSYAGFDRTTLWEGGLPCVCSYDSGTYVDERLELIDDMFNYDTIEINYRWYRSSDGQITVSEQKRVSMSEFKIGDPIWLTYIPSLSYAWSIRCNIISSTVLQVAELYATGTNSGILITSGDGVYIDKVTGIKSATGNDSGSSSEDTTPDYTDEEINTMLDEVFGGDA